MIAQMQSKLMFRWYKVDN